MNIASEKMGKVMVLRLQGQLVHPLGDAELRRVVKETLGQGEDKLVLDLSGVPFVDSAGVGELVACVKRVKEAGGQAKFCNVTQRVSDTLMLLGLGQIFDLYGTDQEAIASFV